MAGSNARRLMPSPRTARGPTKSLTQVVSTYVAPAQKGAGAGGLLEALGVAGAAIYDQREELQKKEDHRLGVLEGLKTSAEQDPAKIKSGEMYAQRSEAFMAGLTESQSQAWAYDRLRNWRIEYESWEGKTSNDPAEFTQWMQSKMAEATKALGTDEFAVAGALPILRGGLNNLSVSHASNTSKRVKADEVAAMKGIVLGHMENHDWSQDEDGLGMVAALEREATVRVRKGLDGKAVNDEIISDVIAFADARNDTRYVEALARGHEAGIYKLSAEQQKAITDADHKIDSEINQMAEQQRLARKRANEAAESNALGDYTTAMIESGGAGMPDPRIAREHPKVYKAMLQMRSAYLSAQNYVDPRVEQATMVNIWTVLNSDEFKEKTPAEQNQELGNMLNGGPAPANAATVGAVYKAANARRDPKSPLNNPTITRLRKNTVEMVTQAVAGVFSVDGDTPVQVTTYSAEYDRQLLNYPPEEFKNPSRALEIHDEITSNVLQNTLLGPGADPEVRTSVINAIQGNAQLREWADNIGLRLSKEPVDPTQADKDAAELQALINGTSEKVDVPVSTPAPDNVRPVPQGLGQSLRVPLPTSEEASEAVKAAGPIMERILGGIKQRSGKE
jgi:hypothetical protein